MNVTNAAWDNYQKYGGVCTRKKLEAQAQRFRLKLVSEDEWNNGRPQRVEKAADKRKAGSSGHVVQLPSDEQSVRDSRPEDQGNAGPTVSTGGG